MATTVAPIKIGKDLSATDQAAVAKAYQAGGGSASNISYGGKTTTSANAANYPAIETTTTPESQTAVSKTPMATPSGTPEMTPTQKQSQVATSAQPTRGAALDYLSQLGYASPDEGEVQGAMQDLASQYKRGLESANAVGQQPPTTQGAAAPFVADMMQKQRPPAEAPSTYESAYQFAPEIEKSFMDYDDYQSPLKQKESLVQEYQNLSKSLGIEQINADLLNAKNIIEGTEDDIRAEVTASGGFATDSLVVALGNARNKTLIKNYNNLLATRENVMQQLQTTMQLSIQDRQMASAEFDRKMNYAFKVAEFKQKAVDNARQTYMTLGDKMGWDTMFSSMSPYEQSVMQKTLGLSPTQMAQLASQSKTDRQLKLQEAALDTELKRAQIANINSQIAERDEKGQMVVDQNGRVVTDQKGSMVLNKEIVNTDAYKAIVKGKDSLQFLKQFEEKFSSSGATSAFWSPRQNADLKAKYNAAILNLKEFFNLGVLNGPDEAILRGVLPDPTNRSATLNVASLGIYNPAKATESGIANMKQMIEQSLDERYKGLSIQYGGYSPQTVTVLNELDRTYIEQKAKINENIAQLVKENPDLTYDEIISIIQP